MTAFSSGAYFIPRRSTMWQFSGLIMSLLLSIAPGSTKWEALSVVPHFSSKTLLEGALENPYPICTLRSERGITNYAIPCHSKPSLTTDDLNNLFLLIKCHPVASARLLSVQWHLSHWKESLDRLKYSGF